MGLFMAVRHTVRVSKCGLCLFMMLWVLLCAGAGAELLQYQARLTDPVTGAPREGLITMTFSLYDVAEAGVPLWSESKDVLVADGLLATLLGDTVPFPGTLFDGRDLWLGIQVGTDDEAVPRQQIASVPYAVHAAEAANAGALEGQQAADFATAAHEHDAAAMTSGTLDEARIPASIARGAEVMGLVLDSDGAGSGLDADLLDGLDSSDFVRTVGPAGISGNTASPVLSVTQGGGGLGGSFTSESGTGLLGTTGSAVNGKAGVHGMAGSAGTTIIGAYGVFGESDASKGVVGISNTGYGVYGWSTSGLYAIRGETTHGTGIAVSGAHYNSSGAGYGVHGLSSSSSGIGVHGESTASTGATYGVRGISASTTQGAGVRGQSGYVGVWAEGGPWGVYGKAASGGYSVYGATPAGGGYAGYFAGNAHVTGTLSKGAGSFLIDHPLDPENKYLSHSFVESPDMMNVYNGNVTLDNQGEAWIDLPEYFETLNRDFRYQLTAIGGPGPSLHVAREIEDNRFQIAGGAPGLRVSWQVTGIRQDPYAEAHRIPVEQDKPKHERGAYLHPEEYGVDVAARHVTEPAAAE